MRLTLAGGAAALAYGSVTFSLAQAAARSDPALAHRLAPYDGRISAALAASIVTPGQGSGDYRRADALARAALLKDPTTVLAVSALALGADARGRQGEARRLFDYAQKLSRRDVLSQLWAIEDAVSRGDIRGALTHYDITLRIAPDTATLLYPILASATGEPPIRAALIAKLAEKPVWAEAFLTYIALRGPDPRATAALFVGLRRSGVALPDSARAAAVHALLAGGSPDQAWRYYAITSHGVDPRRSRDPRFTGDKNNPSDFDWVALATEGLTATLTDGAFDFAAPASAGGPLLQQTQVLPPGVYRLTGHSDGIDQVENARPYWTLRCEDGRELGRVVLPNSAQANGAFTGAFDVPRGCPVQVLTLIARPSDMVAGLTGRIDRVQLMPTR